MGFLLTSFLYQHNARQKSQLMDKFKKIDKEFSLTDSTVNSYGFRLLTTGYLMAEYKKNPIGYHMHDRPQGVLVKWEDLRVDGDTVWGKPVINMSHPRGQQTVDEIENGFLNAASVGHLICLEYSDDPALKLEGQTGLTVTKWFNRECSLVDIPGNFNALSLFDKDENPINLADFTKPKISNMKQIFFTGAQIASMNLKADASETEIATAFTELVAKAAKADGLQTQIDNLKSEACTSKVSDLITAALAAGKITKEAGDKLKVDYATNPDGLKNLIDSLPKFQPVTEVLNQTTISEKRLADLMGKSWDELMEQGLMEELKAKSPENYKLKFKETFGKEPQ